MAYARCTPSSRTQSTNRTCAPRPSVVPTCTRARASRVLRSSRGSQPSLQTNGPARGHQRPGLLGQFSGRRPRGTPRFPCWTGRAPRAAVALTGRHARRGCAPQAHDKTEHKAGVALFNSLQETMFGEDVTTGTSAPSPNSPRTPRPHAAPRALPRALLARCADTRASAVAQATAGPTQS